MDAAMCDAAVFNKVMSHSSELRARTPGAPTVLTYTWCSNSIDVQARLLLVRS